MVDISTWDVVFIDDEPDNVGVVDFVFKFHDIKMRSAENGEDGLTLLRQQKPSFLLLDIQMPKMSGFDVLREIRADTTLKDLPVIAVTAHAMKEDRERAMAAGFNGYITKPISPRTFITEIQQILAEMPVHE